MTQKRRRNFFFFSAGIPYSADKNIMEDFPLKNEEGWSLLAFEVPPNWWTGGGEHEKEKRICPPMPRRPMILSSRSRPCSC
jgi:hypothetical protein